MTINNRNQYNVAKKTCLALVGLMLIGVQAGAPVAMAKSLIPSIFIKKTETAKTNDKAFVLPEKSRPAAIKTIRMDATAYTSRPEETDGSPFITADGSVVRDGIIATNVLPIGTKVRLPTIYGDKIFEVRDRMNARYTYRLDVWMSDYNEMIHFGIKRNIPVEIIEMGDGKKSWDQWKGRSAELHQVGKYGPPAPPLPQPYLVAKSDDQS